MEKRGEPTKTTLSRRIGYLGKPTNVNNVAENACQHSHYSTKVPVVAAIGTTERSKTKYSPLAGRLANNVDGLIEKYLWELHSEK